MAYIVFNVGYNYSESIIGKSTGTKYEFRKRFVTKVDNKDVEQILSLGPKDISWCPSVPRDRKPFVTLDEYLVYLKKIGQNHSREDYLKNFLF